MGTRLILNGHNKCKSPCNHYWKIQRVTNSRRQSSRSVIDQNIMKQWIARIGLTDTDCRLVLAPGCSHWVFSPSAEQQVNVCYFCQSSDLTSPPSTPQSPLKDGLFSLCPNEKLMSAADTLLLFCIDISGSMSITSQVKKHDRCRSVYCLQAAGFYKCKLWCFKLSISVVFRCQWETMLFTDPVLKWVFSSFLSVNTP